MTRTVKEWIDFLNMGDNHYIGLQNGIHCSLDNYFKASECVERFEGWLNEIVIKAHVLNFVENGNNYHLLILKK